MLLPTFTFVTFTETHRRAPTSPRIDPRACRVESTCHRSPLANTGTPGDTGSSTSPALRRDFSRRRTTSSSTFLATSSPSLDTKTRVMTVISTAWHEFKVVSLDEIVIWLGGSTSTRWRGQTKISQDFPLPLATYPIGRTSVAMPSPCSSLSSKQPITMPSSSLAATRVMLLSFPLDKCRPVGGLLAGQPQQVAAAATPQRKAPLPRRLAAAVAAALTKHSAA